ncbi:sigma-70 family RNA polymerase sigma factor [Streptomyces sp. NPDC017991]|uniref:sigma-70 family RNA polymerase sigma factor n=1 Tax=Streptomyces sp. NPDC017991 TaxID=3365026 RepID=UPI0037ADC10F
MSWTVMGSAGATEGTREQAMHTLCQEHVGDLYSYVLRLLGGDRHKAEDVVQEVLLRCWRTQRLDDQRHLRPWLFRVARNYVVDDYRMRAARPQEVDGNVWLGEVAASSDEVDRVLSSMVLQKAFETLSYKHREVLYETYYNGRSTREVALVLSIAPGTVKSRLFHAIRALRLTFGAPQTADPKTGVSPERWDRPAA